MIVTFTLTPNKSTPQPPLEMIIALVVNDDEIKTKTLNFYVNECLRAPTVFITPSQMVHPGVSKDLASGVHPNLTNDTSAGQTAALRGYPAEDVKKVIFVLMVSFDDCFIIQLIWW